jgi:hypothetical protein
MVLDHSIIFQSIAKTVDYTDRTGMKVNRLSGQWESMTTVFRSDFNFSSTWKYTGTCEAAKPKF